MKYIIDNNSLTNIFRHYYFDSFPTLWLYLNELIENNEICSVREVRREIENLQRGDALDDWLKINKSFFKDPTVEELNFITEIYKIKHFQQNMEKKKLMSGGSFADPFQSNHL